MNNNELFLEGNDLPEKLPRKELLELLAKAKEGSKEAREQITNHNIRLVLDIVKNIFQQLYMIKKI